MEHAEDGFECWCQPEIIVCDAEDEDGSIIVVHNDVRIQ